MTKRIFAMVLVVCMTLTLLPVSALAARSSREDQPLAEIAKGEEILDRAEEAAAKPAAATDARLAATDARLAATDVSGEMSGAALLGKAVGGVITLTGDVSLTSKMGVSKDLVLDLNGHTVTATGSTYFSAIDVYSGKTLTIQDSVGGGKITDSGNTGSGFSAEGVILTKGTLNLLGGTIESAKTNCVRVGANSSGGKVVLDGADLVCTASMKSGIEIYQNATAAATAEIKSGSVTAVQYGLNVGKNHNATVTGGTITVTGSQAHGVQVGGNCNVSVKNCTINATGSQSAGVYAGSNQLALEDVVINGKAQAIFLNSPCAVTISGENTVLRGTRTIVLNNGWSDSADSSLTITGGTVISERCNPIKTIDLQGTQKISKPVISGGSFSNDVSEYCEEGFKVQLLEDGSYGIVEKTVVAQITRDGVDEPLKFYTLQDALAAAQEGETVTMLADETVSVWNQVGEIGVPLAKNVTIDGNLHTLTIQKIESNGNGSYITYGAEGLTVQNLTVDQTGVGNGGFSIGEGSKLEYVTVKGGSYGALTGSNVTIDHCTFTNVAHAIYTNEDGVGTGLKITNNTFTGGRAIILRSDEVFTGNTVEHSDTMLTVDTTEATVTNNKFSGSGKLSLYADTNVEGNAILCGVKTGSNVTVDLSDNYWGESEPTGLPTGVTVASRYTVWDEDTKTASVPTKTDGAVAQVGDQYYATLQAAITAAGADDTITLLQDVNLTKAIQLNKSVKIDGGANKYALSSTAPGGRMFEALNNSECTAIEMTNVTLKIKANGTYGAVPFYNHKTDNVLHFSFADGSIVAAEEENVYLVNLFQGQNVKYTFTGNTVAVPAQGLLVNMADDSAVTNNTIDLKGEAVAANSKRTGVISVNEKNVTKGITVTGNTFKNANRVLGVDHAVGLTNDNLTFKDNAMIDCRWAFELNPEAQSGFDLSENYYKFGEEEPGVLRVENSEAKGSHFEFGNETGTEYVLTDTNSAVEVNSYYTDEAKTELVNLLDEAHAAAKIVDGENTTYYKTLQAAIAAAGANDTVKVLKDVALTKSIDPDKSITIEGVTKEDGSKPVISGDKGLFSITQGSATLKNLELQATGNTWYIYQETELTVDSCDFTMADGVTEVGNLIMDDGHGKVTFTNNHVLAHSRVALAGPGNDSVITNNVFDLVNEQYGTSRTSVIGLVATEASGPIVITGNTFKNANRVLGVDNSYAKVADKLTFKNNSFIDCRWTLELDPNTQSGFDLSENYYCFNNTVGMPRVENAASSGSHFEFGNETGTEYVLTDTNNAVEVNSYYTDADRKELVTIAAQVIAVADGAVTSYATVTEALAASNPGDTLKLLALPEEKVEIPDGKAVRLDCSEEVAGQKPAAWNAYSVQDWLAAYFDYQARTRNSGGTGKFALYGGVEAGLAGENTLRVKGVAGGTTYGVTIVDLLKDWALTGNVTLPSRSATTTSIYALADVTVDLNGNTLEQEPSALRDPSANNSTTAGWDGYPAIIAYNDKTVTVKDSSANKTGKVIGSAQTFDVYPGATLNLESGTFTTKGNWYDLNDYGGFGSIVRMDGGTLNISGGKLTIPENNAAHSVKMAATIMLRGKVAENPTRAYAINITGGVIETVPESKRAPESFKTVYSQTDGFVAINRPVITDETNPDGKNITYSITGGTFDMELQGAKDATEKPYLGEGYVSPEDEENEDHFVVKACDHADVTVTREDEHDATCTEDGSYVEVTTCNTCGNVTREDKTSEKLGHNTDGVVEHKDATCTEDGVEGGVYCTRCNDGKEAAETAIGKLGHDLTKWAHDDVNHWHVCSRCDADVTDTPAAHTWVQGAVSGGRRTDTCECGAERTVSVSTGGNNRPRPTPPEEDLNEPDVPLTDKPFLFTDVTADDWYYDAVKYVSAANMMIGVNAEGTLFAPALSTTRASVAQILFRLEKEPTAPIADFDDVREGAWYTDAVNWNDEVGLMVGYGDGTFRPDVNVTREQLVTVLYRYAKHLGLDVTADGDLSAFDDADEVAAWAEDAMAWAVNVGIIKGRNGTRLAPDGTASRSELASILQRFQKLTAAEKD